MIMTRCMATLCRCRMEPGRRCPKTSFGSSTISLWRYALLFLFFFFLPPPAPLVTLPFLPSLPSSQELRSVLETLDTSVLRWRVGAWLIFFTACGIISVFSAIQLASHSVLFIFTVVAASFSFTLALLHALRLRAGFEFDEVKIKYLKFAHERKYLLLTEPEKKERSDDL